MLSEGRLPTWCVGRGHVTIGSDLLAISAFLRMPDQILGGAPASRLEQARPEIRSNIKDERWSEDGSARP